MKEYKNKRTAMVALRRLARKEITQECPLWKTDCRGQICKSYNEGRVYSSTKGYGTNQISIWRLYPPGCESPLVTGYLEIDVSC